MFFHKEATSSFGQKLETSQHQHRQSRSSIRTAAMPSELVIKFIFLLIGVGVLLPWNAFISAKPYFQSRLCEKDTTSSSNVELWFGLIYNFSAVLSLGVIITFQWILERQKIAAAATISSDSITNSGSHNYLDNNDITLLENELGNEADDTMTSFESVSEETDEKNHSFWMVRLPLSVYVTVFFCTAIVVLIPSMSPSVFLKFTLFTLALCGPGACIGNAGILAMAGLFPAQVGINPFFQGQAVGGLAVAVANYIAATFQDSSQFQESHCNNNPVQMSLRDAPTCSPYQSPDWITFTYFGVGSLVLIACLLGYGYIEKYHQSQYNPVQEAAEEITTSIRGIELLHDESVAATTNQGAQHESDATSSSYHPRVSSSTIMPRRRSTGTTAVWLAISGPAVTIFLTYLVTLAIFPGFTSTLRSVRQCTSQLRIFNDLYTPMSFVLFNAGDLLGRLIAPKVPIGRIANLTQFLVLASCLRFTFFPLILFCESGASRFVRIELSSDLFSVVVQLLFAISNGFLVSLAFVHGSGLVPATAAIQQKVSEWLNLAVGSGLLVGSLLSFPFARVAAGYW